MDFMQPSGSPLEAESKEPFGCSGSSGDLASAIRQYGLKKDTEGDANGVEVGAGKKQKLELSKELGIPEPINEAGTAKRTMPKRAIRQARHTSEANERFKRMEGGFATSDESDTESDSPPRLDTDYSSEKKRRRGYNTKPKECIVNSCNSYAADAGFCIDHFDKIRLCAAENCGSKTLGFAKFCSKHGGTSYVRRTCIVEGCIKCRQGSTNFCFKHGATRPLCMVDGCGKYMQKDGLCARHGGKKPRCKYDNCTKYARKGGVCIAHGAARHVTKPCVIPGCTRLSQTRGGFCICHGKTSRCTFDNCNNIASHGSFCPNHLL